MASELEIEILNYGELLDDCKVIIEVCHLLTLSYPFMHEWLDSYITRNIKIGICRESGE